MARILRSPHEWSSKDPSDSATGDCPFCSCCSCPAQLHAWVCFVITVSCCRSDWSLPSEWKMMNRRQPYSSCTASEHSIWLLCGRWASANISLQLPDAVCSEEHDVAEPCSCTFASITLSAIVLVLFVAAGFDLWPRFTFKVRSCSCFSEAARIRSGVLP